MDMADKKAERSHDAETKVGCILINNESEAEIAMGYNGFVRGASDKDLPNKRPDKYQYMVHAEQNLMANCARHGISMENCTVVCTMSPCVTCMRLLFQAGITRVIVKEKYRDFEKLKKMKDLEIEEKQTPEGFWELRYKVYDDK